MLTVHLVLSTILIAFFFVIWSKNGWQNLLLKLMCFGLTVTGVVVAYQQGLFTL